MDVTSKTYFRGVMHIRRLNSFPERYWPALSFFPNVIQTKSRFLQYQHFMLPKHLDEFRFWIPVLLRQDLLHDVKMLTKVNGLERVVLGAAAPAASILLALSCSRGRFCSVPNFCPPGLALRRATSRSALLALQSLLFILTPPPPLPLPCSPISHLHWSAPV